MQSDRWLISTGPEQEPFSLSAGPVGFPIWIDDEANSAQPELSPARGQEEVEDVDEQKELLAQNAIAAGLRATLPQWPERHYDVPNPATPIPPRASAYPSNVSHMRPRFPRSSTEFQQEEDVTRAPTVPQQTMWQHESPDYRAESSLPSLSLVSVEEASPAVRPPSIDELDTLPPARRRQRDEMLPARPRARRDWPQHDYYGLVPRPRDVSELATNPPPAVSVPSAKLRDEHFVASPAIDDMIEADTQLSNAIVPLEASPLLHPAASRLLVSANVSRRGRRQEYRPSFALHPLDRVRWWLLYPGRLELLLWLTGTALLVAITCVLLFVTTISLGIVSFGHSAGALSTASAAQCIGAPVSAGAAHCDSSTALSPAGLKITLQNTTALLTSTPVQLRGDGFSPRGSVTFTYDNNQPCSPASVQADGHGGFTATVTLPAKPALRPGHHRLVVYDQVRRQSVSLDILFTADTTTGSGA
jgi:hypothetical protein